MILQHLEDHAGKDPMEDRYHCGYLAAANDFLKTNLEVKETPDD